MNHDIHNLFIHLKNRITSQERDRGRTRKTNVYLTIKSFELNIIYSRIRSSVKWQFFDRLFMTITIRSSQYKDSFFMEYFWSFT